MFESAPVWCGNMVREWAMEFREFVADYRAGRVRALVDRSRATYVRVWSLLRSSAAGAAKKSCARAKPQD
jgi:hypothetical protein